MSQSIIKKIKNFLFVVKSSLNHPLNKNMKINTVLRNNRGKKMFKMF